jgi:hypothetical protein
MALARATKEGYSRRAYVVKRVVHAIRSCTPRKGSLMNTIIYIVGVVVIVLVILWFFGLR